MIIQNRKARHDYDIIDEYVCGIILKGSEVKSIRNGKANISESFCIFLNGELFLKNAHISKHKSDKFTNHDELRDRKLLLTKKELRKLSEQVQQKGLTIIPLQLFTNDTNLIKIKIALCKGKKDYDKRESIKEKDIERSLQQFIKNY